MKKTILMIIMIWSYFAIALIFMRLGEWQEQEKVRRQIKECESPCFISVGDSTYLVRYYPF